MKTRAPALALLLAALLATIARPARADDPDPPVLHALVTGGDADRVVRAISGELGRTVSLIASNAPCPAPCAAIAIDAARSSATVRLTAASGELRQRTIAIPADPAGAAEVIALLVGNLARDEADALLGELAPDEDAGPVETPAPEEGEAVPPEPPGPPPMPPGPPPVLAQGEPAEEAEPVIAGEGGTSISIGLLSPLSIRFGGAHRRGLSIQALIGVSRETHLLSLAGVVDTVSGDVYGAQIAGVVASGGRVHGAQIGGAVAVAGAVDGVQVGGAVAASRGRAGIQVGGAVATAGGRAGIQVAGAVNTARGGAGVQVAGAVNTAGGSAGLQIAGAVNVARADVYGAQIGVVNVAGSVHGLQLGVVNIARRDNGGLSLGLINIVPGGRSELEATFDTDRIGAIGFRHGGSHWHNVYGVAGRFVDGEDDDDLVMYGFGFGPTWRIGGTTFDADLLGWHVLYGDRMGDLDLLLQLRAMVAIKLGGVQVLGGAALNGYVTTDENRRDFASRRMEPAPSNDGGVSLELWPSAFVGVRL